MHDKNHFIKIAILFAGPFANYAFAVLLFFLSFFIFGKQVGDTSIIDFSSNNSPAVVAGMRIGDKVIGVNDIAISNITDLQKQMVIGGGEPVQITVVRNNKVLKISVKPVLMSKLVGDKDASQGENRYIIGIKTPPYRWERMSFFGAAKAAFTYVGSITIDSAVGIYKIATTRKNVDSLSGPLKIAKFSGGAIRKGFNSFITFLAFLSVGLGFFNLLPVPLLDGGQIIFYTLEAVIGRALPAICYSLFYFSGVALIVLAFGFVLFNDVRSVFFG